ncbi:phage tail assembly chaperone [Propionivibrio sp.]|uniref:phage tail assembly chaperone n=1 Tax=Propionivibrio sp. TaxID=2212460 RepID=UPI003BF2517C
MFKLEPNPTFWAEVGITVPGEKAPAKIEIEFKHMSVSEWEAYRAQTGEKPLPAVVTGLIVGWRNVDVPYSADALTRLLDRWPRAAIDLFESYSRELFEARTKN